MKILNLGRILSKNEKKSINGGFAYTFFIEGDRYCVDCSQPISWEDNPTDVGLSELEARGCRRVHC
ncbi:hypothetical protein [Tenacibaculum sp. nBUS_03]|uniref:hypothetical protein n=1 Tax=Tenacibaculum sp. nBUS_03 TaxID=3395320 RepID=UPI003EB7E10E